MVYNNIVDGKAGEEYFFMGNEAIVRGALESGVDLYTFYPGTPSSEVGEIFMAIFRKVGMKWVESSTNEKVALEVAGAAYARGARAMVGMKNVGLNVASDPLFALSTTHPKNWNSSMVIVVADDPQQHSSAVELDSRQYLKLFKIPALEPSNPQECLNYTKRAFEISRELKIPVILRTVTMVSHARSNVTIGSIKNSELEHDFDLSKEVNVASRIYFLKLKEEQIYIRMRRALELSEKSKLNKIYDQNYENKYGLGIITSGVSFSYIREALEFLGIKAPILKIGFINPLPQSLIADFLRRFKQVLIVEENDAYLETQILAIAHKNNIHVNIHGKDPFAYSRQDSSLSFVGELNPTKVALKLIKITGIKPMTDLEALNKKEYDSVKRVAVLCPGCPHRTTGYALQKAVTKIKSQSGKKVYFYQDIGCYTLLSYPPLGFANVKYCMGSSIALAQGVAHTDDSLNIAIIGDGTFFHSGIPALLNGIYNKAPILVLILDNGWIGMTGQQPHPGSDIRYYDEGQYKKNIDLEKFLEGTGARVSVIVHQDENQKKYFNRLKELLYERGKEVLEEQRLQVVLIKDECIQKYTKRRIPIIRFVNVGECKNCRLCYDLFGCPAIKKVDEHAKISSNLCSGCGICEDICPNNAIERKRSNEFQ